MTIPNTSLIPVTKTEIAISAAVERYVRASKSPNTLRSYKSTWNDFTHFCQSYNVSSLPATTQTIIAYLELSAQGNKPTTLKTKLAGISYFHRLANVEDPTQTEAVTTVMAGIRRTLGTAPDRKKPITRTELANMVDSLGTSRTATRDRSILLLGFGGAFRRSEIVGLNFDDLDFSGGRLTLMLRKSKTDQEGRGVKMTIPALENDSLCPVQALLAWLNASGIRAGAVFRKIDRHGHLGKNALGDHAIAKIIKQSAKRVGLDADQFSGHSLRVGFITQSALDETPEWQIQQVSRHRNTAVMRDYIRDAGVGQQKAIRKAFGE